MITFIWRIQQYVIILYVMPTLLCTQLYTVNKCYRKQMYNHTEYK